MPPRSKSSSTKFERSFETQTLLHSDILHSQQVNGELADTELICDGGCIRVHGFLLQAASPFIQKAMASQGVDYPHMRKILLPDFPVKQIERMLSLVYKGYADLPTDQDVDCLKEVLTFFQVSKVDFKLNEDADCRIVEGALKVQELNRIPQDIFKAERHDHKSPLKSPLNGPRVVVTIKSDKKKQPGPSQQQQAPVRRSGRPQKPIRKIDNGGQSDDSDFKANSGADSSDDDESESKPKRGRRPAGSPRVVKTQIKTDPAPTNVTTPSRSEPSNNSNTKILKKDDNKDNDSGTDSEDDDWVKPNFKDKDWFTRESTRCQCCKKTYDAPAQAALCITSHKTLRCYFCFRVYSTTDILFKHFKRRHKQAGRESTLICPFCDQAVPYKSVSCHVISVHLSRNNINNNNANSKFSPAKPAIVASTPLKPKSGSSTGNSGSSSSRGRRRSRSRSVSNDRASSSSERHSQKKIKKDQGASHSSTKKTQLKITNLKDIKKALIENKKKQEKKLQVRDLDVTLEKKTAVGKTIVFRIQKVRPALDNGVS